MHSSNYAYSFGFVGFLITNLINDLLHKISTYIAQNHGGTVVVEDLKIKNMMKSARGTASNPGRNVSQKAGLNRSIARVSWRKLLSMLEYKLERYGGRLVFVNPKHTSQTCPKCGHVSPKNRTEQAKFKCTQCGYEANADVNAAQNISTCAVGSHNQAAQPMSA